jgi:hypothetical protein
MKRRLRDLPSSPFFTVDMRCDCGAPLDGFLCCIVSGKMYRYCETYSDGRDGDDEPPRGAANLPHIVEPIKEAVKATRSNYFQEMKGGRP